ncbi:MAG: response regulator [Thermotaleaceae bacterium]
MGALFRSKIFRRQFFAFLLIICSIFITISLVFLRVSELSSREQYLDIAENYRNEVSETIERWIQGRVFNIRTQAAYLSLLAENKLDTPEITEILQNQLIWNNNFYNIIILDRNGDVVNSKDGPLSLLNAADREYFIKAINGTPNISSFFQIRTDNNLVIAIGEPIYIDGEVAYVLAGYISIDRIKEIVQALNLGEMVHVYLVDSEGTFITNSRFIQDFMYSEGLQDKSQYRLDTEGVQGVLQGEKGVHIYGDFHGKRVFGAYEWMDSIQAGLIVEFMEKEMIKPLMYFKRVIYISAVCVILIGIVLGFALTKKILDPLNMLIVASRNIARQNYQTPIIQKTNSEWDVLIDTFNKMQEAIFNRELELMEKNTALRVQRAEAVEANKLKSQFLANMSHELRTPLNAIIGFTGRVIKKTTDILPPVQLENLQIVKQEAQHLLDLINDLLDYSKIEAGKMEINVDDFRLDEVLREVYTMAQNLAEDKPIDYQTILYTSEPIYMRGDRIKVKQILINLLSNAFKYSDKGTITVTIKKDDFFYQIEVQDEGVGIKSENLESIFEEFRQVDGSYTRKVGGTGLGLSITKGLVEMLGGFIEVKSILGKGSTFTVHLPIRYDKSEGSETKKSPVQTLQPTRKILCIDDDPNVQRLYKQYLGEGEFEVYSLVGDEDISKEIKTIQPDVIVLDIMLPHKDGWEILAELKKNPDTRKIPVIMASVLSEKKLAYQMRADEYLIKPVEQQEFLDAIYYAATQKEGISILIADDDEKYLNLMGQFLQEENIAYRFAADGEEALRILKDWYPDVLILDIMMPHKDGFAVIDEVQRRVELRDMAIIVVTAKDLDKEERSILRKRANKLIQKSGDPIDSVMEFLFEKIKEKLRHEENGN